MNIYFIMHYYLFFHKEFFFVCLYFSEYDVRMFLLFFGWEIGHLLSTYITRGMEGRPCKMCTGAHRGKGLKNWSWDTYLLNGWPQANVVESFLCFGLVKYTRASPPYTIIRISSPSSIFESPQKNRHSIFLKESLTQMFV